jgi:hypothetical protein
MAKAALRDAAMKPRRRPTLCISMVAGIVVIATATIIIDCGRVANALLDARPTPMTPANVTMTIMPVAEISWQVTSKARFRACISRGYPDYGARILT